MGPFVGDPSSGVSGLSGVFGLSFASLGDVTLEAALTVAALVGTFALWSIDRFVFQRRKIAYRVQMDTPLHVTPATELVDIELRRQGRLVHDASLVLLRIDNVGGKDLEPRDIHHPLTFSFPDRTILGVEITNPEPPELKEMLLRELEPDEFIEHDRIELPKIALNRGNSFKLFILLTGTGTGVHHAGFLAGGGRGSGIRRDNRVRGPLGRGLIYGTISAVLVGVLVGVGIIGITGDPDAPSHCVAGRLEIVGSTAFEPAVKELRGAYVNECAAFDVNPDIDTRMTGSRTGARMLHDVGEQGQDATDIIAMSDGTADPNLSKLRGTSVAVLVFAVVVNNTAGVTSLTTGQLNGIYTGTVTNWSQLGGNDKPIKMVSRIGPDSGSRRAFQDKALGGSELGITSDDCESKDDPAAGYYRCEVGSTRELLEHVDRIDGAIGYAELGASSAYTRVRPVSIDDQAPEVGNVIGGRYRFCAREYAYTYQEQPRDGTLAAEFLDYLRTESARSILRRDDLIPSAEVSESLCG
jgi:phosphate transport system substrate-binding protein